VAMCGQVPLAHALETYENVARQYGTPTHVLDLSVIGRRLSAMRAAWRDLITPMEILYSVKTNYLPVVLQYMQREVGAADVVSGYEMRAALRVGFDPARMCFNGPMKTADEMEIAISRHIIINIDSPFDLDCIASRVADQPIEVGLRINPGINVYESEDPSFSKIESERVKTAKFGWPIGSEGLEHLLACIDRTSQVQLTQLHTHVGSQVTDCCSLVAALDHVLAFCARIRPRFPIRRLNIGGGFGVPGIYRQRSGPLYQLRQMMGQTASTHVRQGMDFNSLVRDLNGLLRRYQLTDLLLQCEPGRALVSDSMELVTRVVSVKPYGRDLGAWIILDGGLNLLPTAGPNEQHNIRILGDSQNGGEQRTMIRVGGPLCYDADVLSLTTEVHGLPRIGDLAVIQDTGAYSISRATNFIRPRAPVALVQGLSGDPELCWRRETDDDVFQFAVTQW
jgi:diaminopimelate decarboxylase